MRIRTSCREYRGDRPCEPNKLRGKECPTCDEFDPIRNRILIIKLGAPGDVLRTTALLPAIHRNWPHSEVTWLTRENAVPLLDNLPLVDRILSLEGEGFLQIQGEWFDACLNLDNEPLACSLATQIQSDEIRGFRLSERGRVVAANHEALPWLRMAIFDRLKKENTKSYQRHMREIIGVDPDRIDPIQIRLTEEEMETARRELERVGFHEERPIAFNTGSGERWATKQWPMESFVELGLLMIAKSDSRILLLGGPAEDERNHLLAVERPDLFVYTGVAPMRVFLAMVAQLRLLVTSDTLASHVGVGCGIPTVVLFGPTSAPEIEGADHLLKIIAPVDCICCYLHECDKEPFCMDELTPELVHEAVEETGWLERSIQATQPQS